jgi:hypothetical protein
MKACHQCGRELNVADRVSRTATCSHCGRYLHSCLNYVSDREKANFCDFFTFRESRPNGKRKEEVVKAKKAWEELFKK